MIVKKIEGANSNVMSIADCLDCKECIHERVCKWRAKCMNEYEHRAAVPEGFPFIRIGLSCTEFKKADKLAEDLSKLAIERIDEDEIAAELNSDEDEAELTFAGMEGCTKEE